MKKKYFWIVGIIIAVIFIFIFINNLYYMRTGPPPLDSCDTTCKSEGYDIGICKSGSGVIVNCSGVIGGLNVGQTEDCKLEGTSGGGWKTCCCGYLE